MKNAHAIIDNETSIVRNVVVWHGAEWTPPRNHFVVHDCDGSIGDYWDRDTNKFYTRDLKRRMIVDGKNAEVELTEDEKNRILPILTKVFGVQE